MKQIYYASFRLSGSFGNYAVLSRTFDREAVPAPGWRIFTTPDLDAKVESIYYDPQEDIIEVHLEPYPDTDDIDEYEAAGWEDWEPNTEAGR